MSTIFPKSGSVSCQSVYASGNKKGEKCSEVARYHMNGVLLCGIHSKPMERIALVKPTVSERKENQARKDLQHQITVNIEKERRQKLGLRGDVIASKLRFLHNPVSIPGYTNIYPNYKMQNYPGGFGCAKLSPKSAYVTIG